MPANAASFVWSGLRLPNLLEVLARVDHCNDLHCSGRFVDQVNETNQRIQNQFSVTALVSKQARRSTAIRKLCKLLRCFRDSIEVSKAGFS